LSFENYGECCGVVFVLLQGSQLYFLATSELGKTQPPDNRSLPGHNMGSQPDTDSEDDCFELKFLYVLSFLDLPELLTQIGGSIGGDPTSILVNLETSDLRPNQPQHHTMYIYCGH
jgi:hypothetical protein